MEMILNKLYYYYQNLANPFYNLILNVKNLKKIYGEKKMAKEKNREDVIEEGSEVEANNISAKIEMEEKNIDTVIEEKVKSMKIEKNAFENKPMNQNLLFIGVGQGGSNLAMSLYSNTQESDECYKDILIFNTSEEDIKSAQSLGVPDSKTFRLSFITPKEEDPKTKFVADYDVTKIGGTGKEREISSRIMKNDNNVIVNVKGDEKVAGAEEIILAFIEGKLKERGTGSDRIVICFSTGGGTGSGAGFPLALKVQKGIDVLFAMEGNKLLSVNKPTVIAVPIIENTTNFNNVNKKQYQNTLECLLNMDKLKDIIPIILVDNSIMKDIKDKQTDKEKYHIVNGAAASNILRLISVSTYGSDENIDSADRNKIIRSKGIKILSLLSKDNETNSASFTTLSTFMNKSVKFNELYTESKNDDIDEEFIRKYFQSGKIYIKHTPFMLTNAKIDFDSLGTNFIIGTLTDINYMTKTYNSLLDKCISEEQKDEEIKSTFESNYDSSSYKEKNINVRVEDLI